MNTGFLFKRNWRAISKRFIFTRLVFIFLIYQCIFKYNIIIGNDEKEGIKVATNMAGSGTDIRLAPGAAELGGLHVIATERHDARCIDRQLFGRCGRWGDPITCEAIVCLENELIFVYTNLMLHWLLAAVANILGGSLTRPAGKFTFRLAQSTAQRQHAKIRRNLLKFDEQISNSLAFAGRME